LSALSRKFLEAAQRGRGRRQTRTSATGSIAFRESIFEEGWSALIEAEGAAI